MAPEKMNAVAEQAHWIDSTRALANLCERARAAGRVALDTEFERTDTYFPKLALVQLGVDDSIALVDPLDIEDATPLRELLEDAGTQKVLHSGSEDVEVLAGWSGARPRGLFDTQIAAALCGRRYGIGYRDLVLEEFALELDKGETRSDWLGRPLSPAQRRYAALDVALLLPLQERQHEFLAGQGRLAWLEEECERMLQDVLGRPGPEDAWRNVKRASILGPRGLAALQRLAAWREHRARELDRPRGWLLKDEHLVTLAEQLPDSVRTLAGRGLPPGAVRRWETDLQELVDAARRLNEEELPDPLPPPLGRADGERLKRLRKRAREQAQALGVAEELLARRRMLEPLFLSPDGGVPEPLCGWRWEVLGPELEAMGLVREAS